MSISLLKLNSSADGHERRESIKRSLESFPSKYVGNKRNNQSIAQVKSRDHFCFVLLINFKEIILWLLQQFQRQ